LQEIKILSWNVNGIRSAHKKGFLEWLLSESPDILCLQETKAHPEQLDEGLRQPHGYHAYWNSPAEKKGYSGVATLSREAPLKVQRELGAEELDREGRILISQYPEFTIFNVYFPNGKRDEERLKYKLNFYEAFLLFIEPLHQKGEKLIICGDVNTAHREIDLARPKENEKISGFLPIEREWMDKFVAHGYVDTFRYFNKEPNQYTWWDMKSRARERNVGWRIDYFFITENLLNSVTEAFILPDVAGSDHCPIGITLKVLSS
jgi:exodeoxyribonuclease III